MTKGRVSQLEDPTLSILMLLLLLLIESCEAGRHEDRLIKDIFTARGYNAYARPVVNESHAVVVEFGVSLQSIVNVDEKTEMLHTNMWLNYGWVDYKLKWNSSDYGGVESIRLPSTMIWTPDILMYNSADEDIDSKYPTNIVVSADGSCSWVPLGLYISSCAIDIRWFPFDDQFCTMKFGSWTYDGSKINLTARSDSVNLETYQTNGEWEVLEVPAARNVLSYDCCPEEYIDITFTIHIRRRTLYYGFNLIIPCALISLLALFTFLLPPDTNAKVGLGITILLSLSVFQLIVAEMVPSTSISVPLVGVYFACVMLMCTISLVVTIVVLSFHHQKPEMTKASPFVQKYICGWLAWLLRMSRPGKIPSAPSISKKESPDVAEAGTVPTLPATALSLSAQNLIDPTPYQKDTAPPAATPPPGSEPKRRVERVRNELKCILTELRFVTRKLKDDDEGADETNDWKFAAMVIDRLCFWIFTIYLVVATIAIFFSSSNLQRVVTGK